MTGSLSFQIEVVVYPYLPHKLRHVRHEDHRTLILVERLCDDGKMAKVDMVRRLVEDEESGFLEDEAHERDESFLSFGEIADTGFYHIARDEESRRGRAELLL